MLRIWRAGFGFHFGKAQEQCFKLIKRLFLVGPHCLDDNLCSTIKIGCENFQDTCRRVTFAILLDRDGALKAYHALHEKGGRPCMQSKLVDDFDLPLHWSELYGGERTVKIACRQRQSNLASNLRHKFFFALSLAAGVALRLPGTSVRAHPWIPGVSSASLRGRVIHHAHCHYGFEFRH